MNDFIKFLRREKVLTKFRKNLKKSKGLTIERYTEVLISNNYERGFVTCAFDFEDSPEVFSFWWDIYEKWREHLSYIIEQGDSDREEDVKDPANKPIYRKYAGGFKKQI